MKVTYGRGYVYSLHYHIVFCVKYRHKVLSDERAITNYLNSQKERGDDL